MAPLDPLIRQHEPTIILPRDVFVGIVNGNASASGPLAWEHDTLIHEVFHATQANNRSDHNEVEKVMPDPGAPCSRLRADPIQGAAILRSNPLLAGIGARLLLKYPDLKAGFESIQETDCFRTLITGRAPDGGYYLRLPQPGRALTGLKDRMDYLLFGYFQMARDAEAVLRTSARCDRERDRALLVDLLREIRARASGMSSADLLSRAVSRAEGGGESLPATLDGVLWPADGAFREFIGGELYDAYVDALRRGRTFQSTTAHGASSTLCSFGGS